MLTSYLEHFSGRAKLLLVLNGCTDETRSIVDTIIADEKAESFVTVVDIPEPIGKAGAVYEGFRQAQTEFVGFVDADGSTTAYEFERLFERLEGADGIIGSRRLPHSHVTNRTVARRFISWSFAFVARWQLRLTYRDTQCGVKIFRTAAVQKILPKLKVRNSAFDLELLLRLQQAGYRVIEEPTFWTDNSSSTMFNSPKKIITSSWDMYRTVRLLSRTRRHA